MDMICPKWMASSQYLPRMNEIRFNLNRNEYIIFLEHGFLWKLIYVKDFRKSHRQYTQTRLMNAMLAKFRYYLLRNPYVCVNELFQYSILPKI